jgi:type I restriction enzyme S subunit
MLELRRPRREFPSSWQKRPLHEVAQRVSQRNRANNPTILTISAQHGLVDQEEYFNRRVASGDTAAYYLLRRGDFAYNKSYSTGYPAGAIRRLNKHSSGVVSPLYICFRPRTSEVDTDFLQHYFQAGMADDEIAWIAKEGIRNHGLLNVGVDDFFGITVSLPPIPEQRRIAEILDTVDESIRSTERRIAKLNEIHLGILDQLIACRALNPMDLLSRRSELRREGWTVARCDDLIQREFPICYGIVQPGEDDPDGVQVVKIKNLTRAISSDLDRVSNSIEEAYRRSRIMPGDVLVSVKGTIGRVAVVPDWLSGNISRDIARIRLKHQYRPAFVAILLQSRVGRALLESTVVGTTRSEVSISELRKLQLPIPEIGTQERIVRYASNHERAVSLVAAELEKLRKLKRGLTEDLLTGRVRVAVD